MEIIEVVCGVIEHQNKVLIAQRSDQPNRGRWEFPGGKVRVDENPFDALQREIKEELDLSVQAKKEILDYTYRKFHLRFILCSTYNPAIIKLKEHLNFKWVTKDELESYEFLDGDVEFVKYYRNLV